MIKCRTLCKYELRDCTGLGFALSPREIFNDGLRLNVNEALWARGYPEKAVFLKMVPDGEIYMVLCRDASVLMYKNKIKIIKDLYYIQPTLANVKP